jgi:outer membrane protein assembly factor BamB
MRGGRASRLQAMAIVALMVTPVVLGDSSVAGVGPEETSWSSYRGNPRHSGLSTIPAGTNKGGLLWYYPFPQEPFFKGQYPGSPSIGADGTIYLTRFDSNVINALSWNGSLLWSYDAGTSLSYGGLPVISDDGVIHVAMDKSLLALFPNGTLWWRRDWNETVYSGPVIAGDGAIYVVFKDSGLFALDPDGTTRWNMTLDGMVLYSPAVDRDGNIILKATRGAEVLLVSLRANGTLGWTVAIPEGHISMSPCIADDGSVLVYDRMSTLYKYNANGTLEWTIPIPHGEEGNHSRVRHFVAAIGPDGTIYSGSYKGLFAVTSEGGIKWRLESFYIAYSPIVSADGIIFTVVSGILWAVDPQGIRLWTYSNSRYGLQGGVSEYLTIGHNGTIIFSTSAGIFAVNGEPPESSDDDAPSWGRSVTLGVLVTVVGLFIMTAVMRKKRDPNNGKA